MKRERKTEREREEERGRERKRGEERGQVDRAVNGITSAYLCDQRRSGSLAFEHLADGRNLLEGKTVSKYAAATLGRSEKKASWGMMRMGERCDDDRLTDQTLLVW